MTFYLMLKLSLNVNGLTVKLFLWISSGCLHGTTYKHLLDDDKSSHALTSHPLDYYFYTTAVLMYLYRHLLIFFVVCYLYFIFDLLALLRGLCDINKQHFTIHSMIFKQNYYSYSALTTYPVSIQNIWKGNEFNLTSKTFN